MQKAGGSVAPTVLILVRHGETAGNQEGRFQVYETPLAEDGRRQARRLAERIAAESPVHAIYTSDLARARETATILGARLGVEPVLDRGLRELDVGEWKGLLRDEMTAQYPGGFEAWLARGCAERAPGESGECADDVALRAAACVDHILTQHPGGRVVVVSHGLTLAILLAHLQGWERTEALRTRRTSHGNTAMSLVEVDTAGARRCLLLACTAHLRDEG